MWKTTLWDYLKSIQSYKPILKKNLEWTTDEENHRGFENDIEGEENARLTAEQKSDLLESVLLKIGTYGPKSAFIDITHRSTSYKYIWNAIRKVCGFPVPGAQLIHYMAVKNSFDRSGKQSYNDHYWNMRDHKIASLMTKESKIKFNGKELEEDETITPSMENQVVADWLEAIGGLKLVKFIGQQYAKELETCSLYDLQETLGQQDVMQAIIEKMNTEETASLNRAQTFLSGRGRRGNSQSRFRRKTPEKKICYFCKELKNGKEKTHDTRDCYLRQKNKGRNTSSSYIVKTENRESDDERDSSEEEQEEERFASMLEAANLE